MNNYMSKIKNNNSFAKEYLKSFKSFIWDENVHRDEPFGVVFDKDLTYRDKLECIDEFLSGYSSLCEGCDIDLNEKYNVATINFTDGSSICIKFNEDKSKLGEKLMCLDRFWELSSNEVYFFKDIDKKNKEIHLDDDLQYNTAKMYADEMEDIEQKFTNYFGELGTGDIAEVVKNVVDTFARFCYENKYYKELRLTENEINKHLSDSLYEIYLHDTNFLSKENLIRNIENDMKFDKNVVNFYEKNWEDLIDEIKNKLDVKDIKNDVKTKGKKVDNFEQKASRGLRENNNNNKELK